MTDFYGTVAGFKTYSNARGRVVASYDDDEIAIAGLMASEYIDNTYRDGFPGQKLGGRTQVREWARSWAVDIYGNGIAGIPTEIEYATYEAQFIHLVNASALTIDVTPSKYKQAAVTGAVSATWRDFPNARDAQTKFLKIDQILAPILTGNGNVSPLSGPTHRT